MGTSLRSALSSNAKERLFKVTGLTAFIRTSDTSSLVGTVIFIILVLLAVSVLAIVAYKRFAVRKKAKNSELFDIDLISVLKKNESKFSKIAYYAILACFVIPMVYLSFLLIKAACQGDEQVLGDTSVYLLMILQCALGALVIHIPQLLKKKYDFEIPTSMYLLYLLFLYCAIFLGEVRKYYIEVPFWDDILHASSSVMTGLFAFMLVAVMNRGKYISGKLPPIFIALFAFAFSISIGALWEIYEFSMDRVLELNMQKYRLDDGTMLIGREALTDTMKDLIVDTLGAFFSATFGYISLKHRRGWINSYIEKNSSYPLQGAENDGDHIQALDGELISNLIKSDKFSPCIDIRSSVTSTNTVLKEAAENGAQNGHVLIAETQTEGRGRLDRRFHSPLGNGIYMSILLRPEELGAALNSSQSPMLTTASAVAVSRAIEKVCGINAGIKWVNDVYVGEKKVCGILTEGGLKPATDELEYAIVGIGINVIEPVGGLPAEIAELACALYKPEETAPVAVRERLIACVLNEFFKLCADNIYSGGNIKIAIIDEYKSRSILDGRRVDVIKGEEVYSGKVVRVNDDCSLEIITDDGHTEALVCGEVRIRIKDREQKDVTDEAR